jgi:hypothetical protein
MSSRTFAGLSSYSWHLYGTSATHKLPATGRNPAETRSMESTGKIGISSDQKAAKTQRISVAPMMDWTDEANFA